MINWIIAGALMAVLMAELVDAWALHHLARRCLGVQGKTVAEQRLVRWYAEGFDHSIAVTAWLQVACLALTLLSVLCGAHPMVIVASVLLTVGAHGERRFSARLRRRFLQSGRRLLTADSLHTQSSAIR
ncbi:MAG: hypothetical protein ACT4PG_00350 [Panacagrimonas sp.]